MDPVRGIMGASAPSDLLVRGLMAWTYLFGAVSFELFGHRHNVITDYEAFFDYEVRRLAGLLGIGPSATSRHI
jgi:hypothetical protein